MSRMLVCGDRRWLDRRHPDGKFDKATYLAVLDGTFKVLSTLAKENDVDTLIEGCAPGGDHAAELWFEANADMIRNHLHFKAEWEKYRPKTGKNPAGAIRNLRMADEGRPDFVVAFHDDLENSRGTRNMVELARKRHIPVFIYTTDAVLDANY